MLKNGTRAHVKSKNMLKICLKNVNAYFICGRKVYLCNTNMSKKCFLHIIAMIAAGLGVLTSCSEQYNILGKSSVEAYEGNKIYLKSFNYQNALCDRDSSEVVHGAFSFEGVVDTVCVAQLFMDGVSLMPVVLESGEYTISFNEVERMVKGGQLNARLYKFLPAHRRLQAEIEENMQAVARMMINNRDPRSYEVIERETEQLQNEQEKLWVSFITDNYNNVLGTTYFKEYVSRYAFPCITPQIDRIIKHAPKSFRSDPEIRDYIQNAEFNMQLMRGEMP